MNALVRIRFGIVQLVPSPASPHPQETNRDFLQIPGTSPDDEDIEDQRAIDALHAAGDNDLRRSLSLPLKCSAGAETTAGVGMVQQQQETARDREAAAEHASERGGEAASAALWRVPCEHRVSSALAELYTAGGDELVSQAGVLHWKLPEAAARTQPDAVVGSRKRGDA